MGTRYSHGGRETTGGEVMMVAGLAQNDSGSGVDVDA